MGTRIEAGGNRKPCRLFAVERVPWKDGEVYLITADGDRRIITTWGSLLDWFCQAVGPDASLRRPS